MFLDNTSGDIFSYNKGEFQWKPIGNVGLHFSRALTEISGGNSGQQVKKVRTHSSNATSSLKPVMIMTSDSDIRCEVKKNYLSHWVMKDIFYEFIVENINTWDPHPINITQLETVQKMYSSLADGERGPQIAEHFNSIVTQFSIKHKHKETMMLLQNFLIHSLQLVSTKGKVGSFLEEAMDNIKLRKRLKQFRVPTIEKTLEPRVEGEAGSYRSDSSDEDQHAQINITSASQPI